MVELDAFQIGLLQPRTSTSVIWELPDPSVMLPTPRGLNEAFAQAAAELQAHTGVAVGGGAPGFWSPFEAFERLIAVGPWVEPITGTLQTEPPDDPTFIPVNNYHVMLGVTGVPIDDNPNIYMARRYYPNLYLVLIPNPDAPYYYNVFRNGVWDAVPNSIPPAYNTQTYTSTEFAPIIRQVPGIQLSDFSNFFTPDPLWDLALGQPAPCGVWDQNFAPVLLPGPRLPGPRLPDPTGHGRSFFIVPCPSDIDVILTQWTSDKAAGTLSPERQAVLERAVQLGWTVSGATREIYLSGEVFMPGSVVTDLVVAIGALVRNPQGTILASKDASVTLSEVAPNTRTPFKLPPFSLFVPRGASIEFAGALHMTRPETKPNLSKSAPQVIWIEE